MTSSVDAAQDAIVHTRGYQQEMLDESLKRNIIIAMDTGSGKTHIAVLRLKIEVEREPRKISWFLAPTVALSKQQFRVIRDAVPVSVGLVSGSFEPNQSKDASLWRRVIETHRIVVSTPQVLLDALRHSYIQMGRDIGLMIFDEAHHTVDKAPYNMIMKEFYFCLLPRDTSNLDPRYARPMILGLTASPIYGGDIAKAFREIEGNLDSVILTPRRSRDELAKHVHRPVFKHVRYEAPDDALFSTNLASLQRVIGTLDIEKDPSIVSLRLDLARASPNSSEYRFDQKLLETILKENTFTYQGLRDFERTAGDILSDLGAWAADWYVWTVLEQAKRACQGDEMMPSRKTQEKKYMLGLLNQVNVCPVSYYAYDIVEDSSQKVAELVNALLREKQDFEEDDEAFSGLVFVTRRDAVLALTEILTHHPDTKELFKIGSLLGTSGGSYRHSFLNLTRKLLKQSQEETLRDFRRGEKNLIISTSVAEEGIDVQACGCVIRWDPPPNMVSWLQSRGRARQKRSTFIVMFQRGGSGEDEVLKWESTEAEVLRLCNEPERVMTAEPDEREEREEFRVPSTGALLTLESALPHLAHFVAVHPNASFSTDFQPLYDLDPPDLPFGRHSFENRSTSVSPYSGPWGSTVTLPRFLSSELRVHSTDKIHPTKLSAHRHAAFKAYKALYDNELLDDHFLPLFFRDDEIKKLESEVEKRVSVVSVSPQMNPWAPADDRSAVWYCSELTLGELPPLRMFTRTQCPSSWFEDDGPPPLFAPRHGLIKVVLRDTGQVALDDEDIARAREYTRRIFWSIHGQRMTWDDLDFSYLFLPAPGTEDDEWEDRRTWLKEENEREGRSNKYAFDANAQDFGEAFWYPQDLAIVRVGFQFGKQKPYRFIAWRYDTVNEEELEDMRTRYLRQDDLEDIPYPLIEAEVLPARSNSLLPITPVTDGPPSPPKKVLLIPNYSAVTLISPVEAEYVFLLPSVLRALAMSLTVQSMRDRMFTPSSHLYAISPQLLTVAMTAPSSQERYNYERLETLGDTVLKYLVSIQLLSQHPLWHEGYLSRRKDHAVANVRLANENISREMFRWIIRDLFLSKKWKPAYMHSNTTIRENQVAEVVATVPTKNEAKKKRAKKVAGALSTKVLADVVESTIGAAYMHGGFELGYECAKFFCLDLTWQPTAECISSLIERVSVTEPEVRKRIDLPEKVMSQVESMLGYEFRHKLILLEALTHPSHQQDFGTISYERMEFIGDAVMDMVVTDYLYRAEGKQYSPGHMHLRKSAVVNEHILAYLCLKCSVKVCSYMPRPTESRAQIQLEEEEEDIYLWKCLLHASPRVLEDQRVTFDRFQRLSDAIADGLENGMIYPWTALTRLQAPKFFSDMIESLLGAVFLDSEGNLERTRDVMRTIGILPILEHIVKDSVDVLHPVSRLSVWASRRGQKVKYKFTEEKGNISCVIELHQEEGGGVKVLEEARATDDLNRGRVTKVEVRFAAAENAIQLLHLS
ncbi:P-loop containing nucleoside triphosphate hydrolase protein [Guyanagaster necrorhizus]|uniref:P-loop containing nucleoside triphosphate hydrolase protein n=1 Tax=Guyanagaster necrorhizus TaxID=856835 RepID=A0A9P7VLW0_9AGAR|nr:P-loop containing nucleoside triphosphate hydrolase protein [Guyanagaster necrorhizus MCA 3950]KAG7442304.1 P-loop containing nucleoside triphosphate hydrolase protein [Guyanagaster necrorhizus MCA 3950]